MTLTSHAKQRMSLRVITLQDIYTAVKTGTLTITKEGHKKYTNNLIHVILDQQTNSVITCFYITSINRKIEKLSRKNKISKRQATKIMRGDAAIC